MFDAQLQWLASRGYKSVGLDAVRDCLTGGAPLPPRWVSITFDDGWRDNYTQAFPLLARYGFCATMFVVTGWIRTGPPGNSPDETMSAEELVELAAAGMTIGSHTATHPRLTSLDDAAIGQEMCQSRDALAAILGAPPRWLCYPYGNWSERVERQAQAAGYAGACSTMRDNRPRVQQLFHLPRVMVMNDTTPARLGYMLSWFYHAEHALKNRRRWRERT